MDLVKIEFPPAEATLSSLSGSSSSEYQPQTVTLDNQGRINYLPIYPTQVSSSNNPLLLANISG